MGVVAVRPGGVARVLRPHPRVADRVLVVRAHVVRVGIGVDAIHVGLVPGGRQGQAEVVAVARAGELHEVAVGEVVLVVAPVAAALAVPVAVVEVAVRTVLVADPQVVLVATRPGTCPTGRTGFPAARPWAPAPWSAHTRRPEAPPRPASWPRRAIPRARPAAEVEAHSLGERHAPLEAIEALDKRVEKVVRQPLAEIRVRLLGEQVDVQSLGVGRHRFGPALPEIVDGDGRPLRVGRCSKRAPDPCLPCDALAVGTKRAGALVELGDRHGLALMRARLCRRFPPADTTAFRRPPASTTGRRAR